MGDAGEELGVVEAVHQELVELEVGHCEVQTHCLGLQPALQLAFSSADVLSLEVLPDGLALAGCAGEADHAEILGSLQVEIRNACYFLVLADQRNPLFQQLPIRLVALLVLLNRPYEGMLVLFF